MDGLNIRPVNPEFNLKECFFQFYLDEKHCDTKILTSDGVVKAHKLILKQNKVFKDLISREDDDKIIVIDLTRFTSNAVRMVIHGIYRGNITYCEESADEVQELVNFFFQTSNINKQDDEPINHQTEIENIKEELGETFLDDVIIIDDSPPRKQVNPGKQKKNLSETSKDKDKDSKQKKNLSETSKDKDSKQKKNLSETSKDKDSKQKKNLSETSKDKDSKQKKNLSETSKGKDKDSKQKKNLSETSKDQDSKQKKNLSETSTDKDSKQKKNLSDTSRDICDFEESQIFTYTSTQTNVEQRVREPETRAGSSREQDSDLEISPVATSPKKHILKSSESELIDELEDLNSKEPKRKYERIKTFNNKIWDGNGKKDAGSSRERDYHCPIRPAAKRPKKHISKSSESELSDGSEDLNSKELKKKYKRIKTFNNNIQDENGKKESGSSREGDYDSLIRPAAESLKKHISKSSESELSKEPKRLKISLDNILDKNGKKTKKYLNEKGKKDAGWIKSKIQENPRGENKNSKRYIEKEIKENKGNTRDCVAYCMICLVKEDKYSDHIKQHRQPLRKKHQCEYCKKVFCKVNMLEWHKKDYCEKNKSKRK